MAGFVTLTCPSCDGKLQITSDIDRFACGYCGAEHVVKRSGGVVALAPVIESIKKVQAGTDRTASELAIKRLRDEITDLEYQIKKAKEDNQSDIKGSLVGIGAIVVVAFFASQSGGVYSYICIGTSVLIVLVTLINFFNLLSGKPLADKLGPLENTLAQKRSELRRHQEIVSG